MQTLRIAALALALGLPACAPSLLPATASTAPVLIADSHSEAEVRAAIVRSLAERSFQTESEEPGRIRAKYDRGGQMIEIDVEYSGSQYRVAYLASEGFEMQKQGGEMLIDERYHKQVKKLKKLIELQLKKPAHAAAEPGALEPEPAPDTRSAGEVTVDLLGTIGYQCAAEELRWVCVSPQADWQLTVSYVPENGVTTIWYDSYVARAFAKPCNRFVNAMNDLANKDHGFSVTCDDSTQHFRFNTAFLYGPDLDVGEWIRSHEAQRATSLKLLRSVGAIRR